MTSFLLLISGFVTAKTDGDFTTVVIPSADLADSRWNEYVYRSYNEANMDQDICTAMCAFDHPNVAGHNCHFTVLNLNTCYLGTLDVETSVLANPVAGVDLLLKTSNFDKLAKMILTYLLECNPPLCSRCCV